MDTRKIMDRIMKNKKQHMVLNNLKGRISKIFTVRNTLRIEEETGLTEIFEALDGYLRSGKEGKDKDKLEKLLSVHVDLLEGTKRPYIRDKIIPLVKEAIIESRQN